MKRYKGGHPAKHRVIHTYGLGNDPIGDKKLICILGGFDEIRCYLQRGIPQSQMIVCDINPSIVMAARMFFPDLIFSPYGDIVETVLWAFKRYGQHKIANISIDLCGYVSTYIDMVREIVSMVTNPWVRITYTFCRRGTKGQNDAQRRRMIRQLGRKWRFHNYKTDSSMCIGYTID